MDTQEKIKKMLAKGETILQAGNKEKLYNVELIQTYTFPFQIKAKDRIEAEKKAREFVEHYNEDDYFVCSAASFSKETYKITSAIKED